MECESCAAKPGSPALCDSCLHNRWTIDRLALMEPTNDELEIVDMLGDVYNKFLKLRGMFSYDAEEFATAIHVAQRHVMARSARRHMRSD